jgi:hypothetical protein
MNSIRTRRGLINLVGRVANVLFGVCDDVDAKYFYSRIKELEHSQFRTYQILNSQVQIVKSVIPNVNSSLIEIERN